MNLSGKTVVITGANGALGSAAAQRAASLDAELVLIDLAPESNYPGDKAYRYFSLDLLDAAAVSACLDQVGPVDAVFNIAGGFDMGTPVYDTPTDQWDSLFKLNVQTMQNVINAVVPGMLERESGSIVNIGALGALTGAAQMGSYCASKSVVMRLTESLSAEVKSSGINVNAVLPSVIDTPANRAAMPDADPSDWVSPADLANVICFLGSDQARAIHGALIPVAGLC
jgi:NAD(P)-dependent dehydrogenase (short-subunit alcohol dehydrogenase family)